MTHRLLPLPAYIGPGSAESCKQRQYDRQASDQPARIRRLHELMKQDAAGQHAERGAYPRQEGPFIDQGETIAGRLTLLLSMDVPAHRQPRLRRQLRQQVVAVGAP